MSDLSHQPPDPLAVALARLEPAPHGFNRDLLMFEAGRASKERAISFWQLVALLAALAAALLAYLYFSHRG